MKLLTLALLALAAAFFGPAAVVGLFTRDLLYHPTAVPEDKLDALAQIPGWERAHVEVGEGEIVRLSGLVRPPGADGAPWIVYCGGNAMSIDTIQVVLRLIGKDLPVGLASFAYRGYDTSEGRPTEAHLKGDLMAVLSALKERYGVAPGRLILAGQSLGTGVVSWAAASLSDAGTPPLGVVLISPYTSMAAVFDSKVPVAPVGFAVRDSYRTDRVIERVKAPVLLIHGDADTLIPLSHSEQLAGQLGDRALLTPISGRGHNDLWGDPRTVEAARGFVLGLLP